MYYLREIYKARYTRASDGSLLEMGFPIIYFMDETWINKNHKKGFTWKRAIQMAGYRDSDGKVNYLPTFYEGDMDLGTGKGKRMILMHFMSEMGLVKGAELIFVGEK